MHFVFADFKWQNQKQYWQRLFNYKGILVRLQLEGKLQFTFLRNTTIEHDETEITEACSIE